MGWILAIFEKGKIGGLLRILLVLLFIKCLQVSKRYLCFRLNDHVHFVLSANLIFLTERFLRSKLGQYC